MGLRSRSGLFEAGGIAAAPPIPDAVKRLFGKEIAARYQLLPINDKM